jgi:hypothetical protein
VPTLLGVKELIVNLVVSKVNQGRELTVVPDEERGVPSTVKLNCDAE